MEIRKKENKGLSFKRLVVKLFTNSHSSEGCQAPVQEESIEKYKNTPYTAEKIFDLIWFATNRHIIPNEYSGGTSACRGTVGGLRYQTFEAYYAHHVKIVDEDSGMVLVFGGSQGWESMYFNECPSALMQQNNEIDYKNFYVI